MIRTGVGVVAAIAAAGAVLWVAHDTVTARAAPTTGQVCASFDLVDRALGLQTLGDEAALPARAAELADLLWRSGSVADRAVAQMIVTVLADATATVRDLDEALAPVAERCAGRLSSG